MVSECQSRFLINQRGSNVTAINHDDKRQNFEHGFPNVKAPISDRQAGRACRHEILAPVDTGRQADRHV